MDADRTKIRRSPQKQVFGRDAEQEILERAIVAYVAITMDGQPYCLPVACAPYGDEILLHGSTASRLFKALSNGVPACVTISLVEGLVLARSTFESSMHYRSLMALGTARLIEGDEKRLALQTLSDHLFPERRAELRKSTEQEIKATTILAFPRTQTSVKISNGQPDDPESDVSADVWAGIVPIHSVYGVPIPAENLRADIDIPEYIQRWPENRT